MFKLFPTYLTLTVLNVGSGFASDFHKGDEPENQFHFKQNFAYRDRNEAAEKKNGVSPQVLPSVPVVLLPSQPCPDNWRISGDFLYLLPTLDDTYFVINSGTSATTFPNGERLNNDFGFNPAFRVGIEYACCKNRRELQAFYSHLTATQEKTIAGSQLWATLGRPDIASSFENYGGTASSALSLLYQHLELNLSQRVLDSCGMHVYIQPGMEYAYLRLNEDYSYKTSSDLGEIDQKSRTWGVGPQIGLGMDWNLYQGSFACSTTQALSLTSLFSGSILMGRGKTANSQTLAGVTQLDVKDEHTWRTIEALHARIGLDYLVRSSRFGVSLGAGYEFNTYLRALTRVVFPDDVGDSLCQTNYYNFDLQGLYVSGAVSF